ncbi:RIMS-binding protein 2 [Elysia marginata]|uniref:RIMS-binding protein 2 n=1 Tax=Elysia marginata TaxID=1093978 RepID=A0AAV4HPY9_9GAST|nr:RIMS-binding protein 2 [Elysia marginata]
MAIFISATWGVGDFMKQSYSDRGQKLELSFKTGDIVLIYGEMDEDGFYTGEVRGQRGLVPSNFLQPAPMSDEEEGASDGGPGGGVSSVPRSRSGESLENALNAMGRLDSTTNANSNSKTVNETTSSPSRGGAAGSASLATQQTTTPPLAGPSSSAISRHGTASPGSADGDSEGKAKKKGGFLNKSRNMLKKLTR